MFMKNCVGFTVSFLLLLFMVGCNNMGEQTPLEPTVDPVETPSEPVPASVELGVSDLNNVLATLDLSAATLTYHGETEATYPANAAIRAESYIEKLKSFTWKKYTPPAEWDRHDDYFCQLTVSGVIITSHQRGYNDSRPLHLITENGEGWFILPYIQNEQDNHVEQENWMIFDVFSSWYAEAQTAAIFGGEGFPLSAEELDYFQEYTASTQTEYSAILGGYTTSASEISCFFTSQYGDTRDMNASEFLQYCPWLGDLEIEDEEEWQFVQKKVDWRFGEDNHLATVGELPVPVHRLPRTYINEILTQYAGITVEEMHTDWTEEALYIPETDCFYTFTSDFGPGMFSPCYGEKIGDFVILWEAFNEYQGTADVLTLQKNGESWHICSHQSTTNFMECVKR